MRWMVASFVVPLCIAACGCGSSTGACVTDPNLCQDDFDESKCNSPWTYSGGQSCADLGFTKRCSSAEGSHCWCLPGYKYCP
jgi:hypothetical protein